MSTHTLASEPITIVRGRQPQIAMLRSLLIAGSLALAASALAQSDLLLA